MNVLIATDAWHPQINGVVTTLGSLQRSATTLGARVEFLTPEGLPSFPLPTYHELRCALPSQRHIAAKFERMSPDAVHIATEGTIGHAVRRFCINNKIPFTTSFTTRFAEYASARLPVPLSWGYAVLRRFHAPAAATMVSTPSLMSELSSRGFSKLRMWSRGVDTDHFTADRAISLPFPRPIFMSLGRIAVEKNLEAFLDLELAGSKVLIGAGPDEARLKAKYPDAHFLGAMTGDALASHLAAADVFVFPSKTDTFGLVQLEALASGVPVAAYPVTGPKDVIGGSAVGVLDEDLGAACRAALSIPRDACRAFALQYSWTRSASQFLSNIVPVPRASRAGAMAGESPLVTMPRRVGAQ